MKKIFALAMSFLMLASMLTVNVSAARDLVYNAPKGTPTIDGKAEDLWDNAAWTNVDLPFDQDDDTWDHALRVKMMWDDTALYLLADMTCPDVEEDNCIVELYLDELNDKADSYGPDDTQVGFNKDGVIPNYGTNTRYFDCETATSRTDTGFIVEASILFFDLIPEVGTNIGLEFMASIQPAGVFAQAFRWNVDTANGDPAPWGNTSAWGTMVLTAAPGEEAPAEPAPEAPAAEPEVPAEPAEEKPMEETVGSVPEAPAEPAPAEIVTAAPQTGDYAALAMLAAAVALAGSAVLVKKRAK